jgi:mercuric ion transport protein
MGISEIMRSDAPAKSRKGWLATGGLIGALMASACCVGPLLLLMIGVSGAWIGNLTALEPYNPVFAIISLLLVGLGFWQVYVKEKQVCADGSLCAKPTLSQLTIAVLWLSVALVALALTIGWWAPLLY